MKGGGEAGGIYGVMLSLNPPPLPWSTKNSFRAIKEGQQIKYLYIISILMVFYYHPKNKKFARINRNQYTMTEEEWKIWNLVLRKNMTWYRFLRQKIIGNYILDFYCHKLKLWIEIDDSSHDYKGEYDEKRTIYLQKLWICLIRYTNRQINYYLNAVIVDVQDKVQKIAENTCIPSWREVAKPEGFMEWYCP